jgi:hypothetical protein
MKTRSEKDVVPVVRDQKKFLQAYWNYPFEARKLQYSAELASKISMSLVEVCS